jgi:hypothetical protein
VVTQVEEYQIAQITPHVHPARQENALAGVLLAQLTTMVRSSPITEKV